MIRKAIPDDAVKIAEIYNYYIQNTIITFEEEPVPAIEIKKRIAGITGQGLPWLVAEEGGKLIGYAYASKWKDRLAYRYSLETTIYMNHEFAGSGTGMSLYSRLIDMLSAGGYHSAIAIIALPNDRSVHFHEKMGFKKVAKMGEVGFKFGKWIDVGYWQRTL